MDVRNGRGPLAVLVQEYVGALVIAHASDASIKLRLGSHLCAALVGIAAVLARQRPRVLRLRQLLSLDFDIIVKIIL